MRKYITTAELRELEGQVANEEISYSRMIELLNEKAEQYHETKVKEISSKVRVSRCKTILLKIIHPFYFAAWLLWQYLTDDE